MSGRVGIREVAQRAGVSVSTVSNVLNKPGRVSDDTVERVMRVMAELGFVRNQLAHQLRTGGTKMLGMVVLNVENPFFAALSHAVESAAEDAGYTCVFGSSDQASDRENRYLDLFEQHQVRGTIITPLDGPTRHLHSLQDRGVPIVLLDERYSGGDFCSVSMDGRRAGYIATRHLIERGRRHIAFLGGPLHQVENRWTGALQACAETSRVRLTHLDTPDQTAGHGRAAAARIEDLPAAERPDAVFAANDLLALGLLQALVVSTEVSLPGDLAVIGCDDIDFATSASLPLSSIRQPVATLAEEAVRLVLAEATEPVHEHERVRLEPDLIVRASTGSRA